jgi:hypothetical protein
VSSKVGSHAFVRSFTWRAPPRLCSPPHPKRICMPFPPSDSDCIDTTPCLNLHITFRGYKRDVNFDVTEGDVFVCVCVFFFSFWFLAGSSSPFSTWFLLALLCLCFPFLATATRIGSLSCVEPCCAVLVVAAAVAMSSPVHSSKNTWPSFPCLSLSVFGNAGGGRHRL